MLRTKFECLTLCRVIVRDIVRIISNPRIYVQYLKLATIKANSHDTKNSCNLSLQKFEQL